jgi:hypothetical protein
LWEVSPERARVYECLLGAFRGGNPLGRIVGISDKCPPKKPLRVANPSSE